MTPQLLTIITILLMRHEGLSLTEYRDSTGNRTIGYGWNLDAHPLPEGIGFAPKGKPARLNSTSEAVKLLDISTRSHWDDLIAALPWVAIENPATNWNTARQAALLDMAFNMGITTLLEFNNTINLMRLGRYDEAAKNMMRSKWAMQVKGRAVTLSNIIKTGVV
jgi:lysozyme